MRPTALSRAALLLACGLAVAGGVASAKDEPPAAGAKDKAAPEGPTLRYAKSYADAIAEARDRGCVLFLTFHGDG